MKRISISIIFCILMFLPISALADGFSLDADGPSSVETSKEFKVAIIAYGADVIEIEGSITLDEALTLVHCESALASPWQLDTQAQGSKLLFHLTDPSGQSAIDSQTDILVLTLKANNIGNANVVIDDLVGTDESGTSGASSVTYEVNVQEREAASNATQLASLIADKGTLSPSFSPQTTKYTLTVPFDAKQVSLFATAQNKNSQVSGTGTVSFTENKKTVNIVVMAQDNRSATVTIDIIRATGEQSKTQIPVATPVPPPPSGESSSGAIIAIIILFVACVLGVSIIVFGLLQQRKRKRG